MLDEVSKIQDENMMKSKIKELGFYNVFDHYTDFLFPLGTFKLKK